MGVNPGLEGENVVGKKGLSDSAIARLDLFVGSIMSTEGASF